MLPDFFFNMLRDLVFVCTSYVLVDISAEFVFVVVFHSTITLFPK